VRTLTLLCAVAGASAGAVDLTPDNFDALVLKSGKAAFIKFLAPW
jgi:protein disulfide-isomerase A6